MSRKRICLAIETTGTHLGLAMHDLAADGFPCAARFFEPAPGQQTDLLFPTLDRLLKKNRLKREDIALVAVDHGPGSFTGVRVGVAAARGIAQSLGLPVVGIGSLEALAWEAVSGAASDALVAARIPAVAGEAYFAVFKKSAKGAWSTVRAPVWTTDAVVAKELSVLARKGAHLAIVRRANENPRLPSGLKIHSFVGPDPSALARLALRRCGTRPSVEKFSVERTVPIYLQPSWAERLRKRGGRRKA